jgi:hypothetical protein
MPPAESSFTAAPTFCEGTLESQGVEEQTRETGAREGPDYRDSRIAPVGGSFTSDGENCVRDTWTEIPCRINRIPCCATK